MARGILQAQLTRAIQTALRWHRACASYTVLTLCRFRQSELVHARWAMLGVVGVLGQEILRPDVFWYEAGLPENLPGPFKNINMGGLLAWEFLLMHWVEVRRWQDYKNFGSVNEVRSVGQKQCKQQSHCQAFGEPSGTS